ncbi:MAG TPA: hypothetical protein DGB85_05300 [Deltaproteobacteria bacterium]|nr:hypothetical protein [Deltaproteobacteria bacterium]
MINESKKAKPPFAHQHRTLTSSVLNGFSVLDATFENLTRLLRLGDRRLSYPNCEETNLIQQI